MAVRFNTIKSKDQDLNAVQQNISDAVSALSAQASAVPVVVQVKGSSKLTGAENLVLVDSSQAQNPIYLVLPGPKLLTHEVKFKINKAGSQPVYVKAVDVPGQGSPTLDGSSQVQINPTTLGMVVMSDGSNYWTTP